MSFLVSESEVIHSMDFLPQKPSQLAAFSVSGMLIASMDFQRILEILHVRYKKVDLKNHTAVFHYDPIVPGGKSRGGLLWILSKSNATFMVKAYDVLQLEPVLQGSLGLQISSKLETKGLVMTVNHQTF